MRTPRGRNKTALFDARNTSRHLVGFRRPPQAGEPDKMNVKRCALIFLLGRTLNFWSRGVTAIDGAGIVGRRLTGLGHFTVVASLR